MSRQEQLSTVNRTMMQISMLRTVENMRAGMVRADDHNARERLRQTLVGYTLDDVRSLFPVDDYELEVEVELKEQDELALVTTTITKRNHRVAASDICK